MDAARGTEHEDEVFDMYAPLLLTSPGLSAHQITLAMLTLTSPTPHPKHLPTYDTLSRRLAINPGASSWSCLMAGWTAGKAWEEEGGWD
eukprot:CAMPEP_0197565312 /NCGR_PEP_ID=MMETSP1320-20131121/31939_1 /TAXON_ID=91990 /ORGANISM="Bolidomonas sp., Strain RCC2347" /LENGTH=88 /DNA_ID=CAMNT_0043127295 /DNA_START=47 /DNA_END=310 /DNA_ORIENTATION=+